MQAQHNLARILRELEGGGEMVITRRRKPVARLLPIAAGDAETIFPDFKARARSTWRGAWRGAGSDALVDESRGAR